MSLFLHLGPAGSGKSTALYEMTTREAAKDFARNFLFVVPEQFTLQTQRDMLEASPSGGIMNIDVLSFPRMAHRVFSELGIEPPVTLEDTGKTMIVKKVALDRADELTVYAGKVHRQGFIAEMKSVIAEFYQYGIGRDELSKMKLLAKDRPGLDGKLNDISVIYDGFRDFINGRFIMNEELLELFIRKAPQSDVLKGACIILDCFTGFTVMQLRCIECLLEMGCDVHIALTIAPEYAERMPDSEDLFYLSENTIRKLEIMAARLGTEVKRIVYDSPVTCRFAKNAALAALERGIFRQKNGERVQSSGIFPISCESPAMEIKYAISEIRRLIADENYNYSDIGIVVGDLETYRRTADREFTRAGIPFFMDSKKNIIGTAPVEMLKSVLEIAQNDFTYESVFRFLKTGLTGIESGKIAELENFCLARAVRGRSMWKKEWTGGYRTRYAIDLGSINETRRNVYELLDVPAKELARKDITVSERVGILQGIMEKCGVRAYLENEAETFKQSSEYELRLRALESGQLFEIIGKVFERITLLLGDDCVDIQEFAEILNTGFSEAKLALIPQGSDSVVIGDPERTRLNKIKALFILGANDGMLPAYASDAGLLSDADRTIFAENDIELSPTGRESAYLSEFYMYLNLTKPSERLYVSYHRMTADKKTGRPSYLIAKLGGLYTDFKVRNIYGNSPEILIGSDGGRRAAADALRGKNPDKIGREARELLYVMRHTEPEEYIRLLEAAFYRRIPEKITRENAAKLYGNMLTGSVTMLEKYASCAFAHFLGYGLKLEERPEYKIGAIEIGNIYHKALECYCSRLKEENVSWHETDAGQRAKYREMAAREAFAEYEDILRDSRRNEYIITRVERILDRTIEILDAQVKAGEFEPKYFEKGFRHANEFMKLDGKIDRMDIAEVGGRKILRVVDYKSGHKSFDLVQLYYGLQIQLAVYMNEGIKEMRGSGTAPGFAGMYYYNIDDPLVQVDSDNAEEIEAELKKQLRMNGPSLDGASNMRLHDTELADAEGNYKPSYTSDVINAGVKKDGTLTAQTKVLTEESFKVIGEYVDKSMADNAAKILDGRIPVNPYEMGIYNACTYCPYGGVCGFEKNLSDRFRTIGKESEDDIWQKLNGAVNS